MNSVFMQGCLTRDMEITYKGEMAIARGSIALDRGKDKDGQDRGADFPSVVAFGKKAEFFERFGKKGRRFTIEGHIQTGSYEKEVGNDRIKVYTTDIVIDRVEFADSKPADQPAPAPTDRGDGFMNIPDGLDDELPFN